MFDQAAWNAAVEDFMAATARWMHDIDMSVTSMNTVPTAPVMSDFTS